ncbi:MAG: disulfide bond formation protein B [Kiloniellales bacterium]
MHDLLARPRLLPTLIVAAGLGALAGAFAFQYWGGLDPCVLCIYQRYAHGAAAAAGLAALVVAGRAGLLRPLVGLAGLAFLAGAAIAAFHVGVEQHWWRGTAECHAPALDLSLSLEELRESIFDTRFVPCDQIPWALFGVSMAGYNFLYSLALGAAVLWAAWTGMAVGDKAGEGA